jgi:two-component system chemotaxis response regulator CheY
MTMVTTGPSKQRAIVVDDSRAMRTILRRALEERGFQVTEAGHGKEALERLGQMRIPHLALVDWNMPEMNGIDLVAALRSDPSYDKLAIVMVTSETDPVLVERALTAGANEYIMKPFSGDILEEKLMILGLRGNGP